MMNNDDFNSWACDVANDYAQARQEMGPDDYEPWDEYAYRRLQESGEAEQYVMSQASTPATSTYVAPDVDDIDLPF
jgi:hypothetical protein